MGRSINCFRHQSTIPHLRHQKGTKEIRRYNFGGIMSVGDLVALLLFGIFNTAGYLGTTLEHIWLQKQVQKLRIWFCQTLPVNC